MTDKCKCGDVVKESEVTVEIPISRGTRRIRMKRFECSKCNFVWANETQRQYNSSQYKNPR